MSSPDLPTTDRRAFLSGLALIALGLPFPADAQPAGKVYRLGFLSPAAPPTPTRQSFSVVYQAPVVLRDLGYVQGRNLVIERRFAEGKLERLAGMARELIHLRVDVIVAVSPAAVHAASAATRTIPIVMLAAMDPIAQGVVAGLARPGGNVTGVVIGETGLADKRLELLREAVPRASRIAVLTTDEPHVRDQVQEAQKAAPSLGVTLMAVEVRNADYERAFAQMATGRAGALLVPASSILNTDRKRIIELAFQHRLPAIYQWREAAEEGGLMAYGSSISALYPRVASFIDRIFKGASPAELPVEQPTTYELIINMKTAKALGLTMPQSLLVRADEVIQ